MQRKDLQLIGAVSGKTIAVLVILIMFLLFLLQNAADVDISLLFWKVTMSRVVLLFGSLLAGCVIGLLIGWEMFGKRKEPGSISRRDSGN